MKLLIGVDDYPKILPVLGYIPGFGDGICVVSRIISTVEKIMVPVER
jgi:hypothetical protein